MKILMITCTSIYKGTYWRAFHFAVELSRRGHQVTLICTSKNNHWKVKTHSEAGVEIVETPDLLFGPLRSGWDLWNILNRILYTRGKTFDVVHAFESRPVVIYPALAASKRKAPLVMDWADWFGKGGSVEQRKNFFIRELIRPVETFFEEKFRNRADATTVICSLLYQKALDLGVPEQKIVLLRNGADVKRFSPQSTGEARSKLGFKADASLIGYVGSIFPQDALFMAAAFEKILQRIPGIRLVVAGYCPQHIQSLVSQPNTVIQTGFVDDQQLNDYLSACDLFWLPLRNSNANKGRFPYKLTDYMSLGRPIVSTDVGDIKEILQEPEIGFLSRDSVDPFVERTVELLNQPDLRIQMGKRARFFAETKFSWEKETDKLEALYQSVLAQA